MFNFARTTTRSYRMEWNWTGKLNSNAQICDSQGEITSVDRASHSIEMYICVTNDTPIIRIISNVTKTSGKSE